MRTLQTPFLVIATLCACGTEPGPGAPARHVGALEDSDAVIAFVHSESRLLAYVCGGPNTFMELSRWFEGSLDTQGRYNLSNDTLSLQGDLQSGTLQTSDGTLNFTLREAAENSAVGLYSPEGPLDVTCRTGVVVLGDGDPPQMQGVGCREGVLEQVTPDRPVDRDGFSVRLAGDSLFVEPVTP